MRARTKERDRATERHAARAPERWARIFQNLVALAGTEARCNCGRKGFLAEVHVRVEPLLRKRSYVALWDHPDKKDPDQATRCEYVWP